MNRFCVNQPRSVILYLLLLTGLLSCQGGPYPVTSPYYQIPAGSSIVVNTTLEIPATLARAYIQSGKVVARNHVNRYHPHCWFLSDKVLDEKQVINPGVFSIRRHRLLEETVMRELRYASLLLADAEPHIMAIEKITELELYSDEQPGIMRLVCNHWTDPADSHHLTIAEIRAVLGELVEIRIRE